MAMRSHDQLYVACCMDVTEILRNLKLSYQGTVNLIGYYTILIIANQIDFRLNYCKDLISNLL